MSFSGPTNGTTLMQIRSGQTVFLKTTVNAFSSSVVLSRCNGIPYMRKIANGLCRPNRIHEKNIKGLRCTS